MREVRSGSETPPSCLLLHQLSVITASLDRPSNCFDMHLLDSFSSLQGPSGLKPPHLLDCLLAGLRSGLIFLLLFLLASFVRAVSVVSYRPVSLIYLFAQRCAKYSRFTSQPFRSPFYLLLLFLRAWGRLHHTHSSSIFLSCDSFRLYVIAHSPHS